jgi:hypothetical protein
MGEKEEETEFILFIDELTSKLNENIPLIEKMTDTELQTAFKSSEDIHTELFKKHRTISSEKVFFKLLFQFYQNQTQKIENYLSKRPLSKGFEKHLRKKIKEFEKTNKINENGNSTVNLTISMTIFRVLSTLEKKFSQN